MAAAPPMRREPHPTVEAQMAAIERVVACVTEDSVRELCKQVGLEYVSHEFLPEGEPGCTFGQHEGCQARPFNVNPNWVINAHRPGGVDVLGERSMSERSMSPEKTRASLTDDEDEEPSSFSSQASPPRRPTTASLGLSALGLDDFAGEELILQVTNPHKWGERATTHSKVGAMTYLKSQGVPLIPAVLDWSADAPSSPLGCEYVLMERAAGVELRQIWDSLTEREQTAYNQQLADWVRAVGALPRPAPAEGAEHAVAGFRMLSHTSRVRTGSAVGRASPRWGRMVGSDMPWVSNSQPFPLCQGYAAFARNTVEDAIARVEQGGQSGVYPSGFGHPSRRTLLPDMRRVLEFIEEYKKKYEATPQQLAETCSAAFGVCHGDLHRGNVLCDPVEGRLTAVIDWEDASWGPREADALEFAGSGIDPPPIGATAGSWERSLLCPVLLDLRFLHYFSATWWQHFIGMERKLAEAPNEAKEAEETARKSLQAFVAAVEAGPPDDAAQAGDGPPRLCDEERDAIVGAVRAMENYAISYNHRQNEAFNLERSLVTDGGAATLAAALPKSRVERLWLQGNQITDKGAAALAAVLPETKLRELVLCHNRVGDDGAVALLAALPQSQVEHIDLCDGFSIAKGRIRDETKAMLRELRNARGEAVRFS